MRNPARRCSVKRALLLTLLVLVAVWLAQGETTPRRPRGIYAVVNIMEQIAVQQKANPSITPAQLDDYFNGLYQELDWQLSDVSRRHQRDHRRQSGFPLVCQPWTD